MSRIAGYISSTNTPNNVQVVGTMLSRYSQGDDCILTNAAASFGWKGHYGGGLLFKNEILIVLDGVLFNDRELHKQLTDPATNDLELIFSLYQKLGFIETLSRINGDFTIALYDKQQDTLWMGRDRFGIKPLYYAHKRDSFAFSSQPRGLTALPYIDHTPDPRYVALYAASHYRTFDNDPHASPYADIRQLPAAHALRYARGKIHVSSYWNLQETNERFDSDEAAQQYQELLLDAVRLRVQQASHPVFSLSGGMDSSSVLCCAATISGKQQPAASTLYTDATYDERNEIRDVVNTHVSDWQTLELGNDIDIYELIAHLVQLHDEPVATATWLSHYLLCKHLKQSGYNALFSGLGGDELNAGEYEYFPFYFADLNTAGKTDKLHHEIACWAHHHNHPLYTKNEQVAWRAMQSLTDSTTPGQCLADASRLSRYHHALSDDFVRSFNFNIAHFTPVMENPFQSCLKNRCYQDLTRETLPCCLRAEDRQCHATGMQHFDPFLDYRLVEFMFRVPGELKIENGVTKVLLRRAMQGILPDATRNRVKKTGWNAPAHRWFTGKALHTLLDIIQSRRFREMGVYNTQTVEHIVNEHQTIIEQNQQRENHMMFIWQMVNLYYWLNGRHENSA